MSRPSAIICTGFHRSGTSLTAQRLQAGGLSLGEQLLPPHPSNPDGHFEDREVVEFNDRWLARQNSSWLHHDQVPLSADAGLLADIRTYVQDRDSREVPWALKDPRVSLCLDAWHQALGERGRYILVVRHWAECAQSLLHRHSREMAHHLYSTRPGANGNFRLWMEPNIGFESWLSYSRRLLAFAASHPGQTVLVTTRAISDLEDFSSLVTGRLGVPLTAGGRAPAFKPELLSTKVRRAIMPWPPIWLERSLDDTWRELLATCDLRSGDESVAYSDAGMPRWVRDGIRNQVARRFPDPARDPLAMPATPTEAIAAATTLSLLDLVPKDQVGKRALAAARQAMAKGDQALAERLLLAGIEQGGLAYPLRLLLGDIETMRGRHESALEYIQASIAERTSDHAVMKLVRCYVALQRWQDAVDLLRPLIERAPEQTDPRLLLARCLERLDGSESAAAALADSPSRTPDLMTAQANLTLAVDSRAGQALYRDAIRQRLTGRGLIDWLAGANVSITSQAVWDRFVEAVYGHWSAILGERSLQDQLGLVALPDPARLAERLQPSAPPPLAIGVLMPDAADELCHRLRQQGWFLDGAEQGERYSPLFERHFVDPALFGLPPGDPVAHAALADWLAALLEKLAEQPRPPGGWAWQHADCLWHADLLLAAMPDLRLVLATGSWRRCAGRGMPEGFGRWAPRLLGDGAAAGTPYWRLKYWVAGHRQVMSLLERHPDRVFHLDAGASARVRALQLADLPGSDATAAAPVSRAAEAVPESSRPLDLSLFDPADVAYLESRGLVSPPRR